MWLAISSTCNRARIVTEHNSAWMGYYFFTSGRKISKEGILCLNELKLEIITFFLNSCHPYRSIILLVIRQIARPLSTLPIFIHPLISRIFVNQIGLHGYISGARSGASWVRKCGKLPIQENLVIRWPYIDRPPDRSSAPQSYQCRITHSTGMATQM